MVIKIEKFGKILISRPAGREAISIILSSFVPTSDQERIELDFAGVQVVAPAWLDEVLSGLRDKYGNRVICLPSNNPSLIESQKMVG